MKINAVKLVWRTVVVKLSWPSAPSAAATLLSDGELARVSTRLSGGEVESRGNT